MTFTTEQAEGFLRVYRVFLAKYVKYETELDLEFKSELGSEVIDTYKEFVKEVPLDIAKRKYSLLDRKLLIKIVKTKEGLQQEFPTLETIASE